MPRLVLLSGAPQVGDKPTCYRLCFGSLRSRMGAMHGRLTKLDPMAMLTILRDARVQLQPPMLAIGANELRMAAVASTALAKANLDANPGEAQGTATMDRNPRRRGMTTTLRARHGSPIVIKNDGKPICNLFYRCS